MDRDLNEDPALSVEHADSKRLNVDLEKACEGEKEDHLDLKTVSSCPAHDLQPTMTQHSEPNAAQYTRFSSNQKVVITAIVSFVSFLAPISSTSILSAIPEVAKEYGSTGSIINISNALYMLFMGISPCFCGPLTQICGRRPVCLICALLFTAFSVGTSLAPNLPSYFIFRMLTAFFGTPFLIIGTACLGDIFTPTARATALGWFFSGTLIGPAFGPVLGGVIVTFRSWRVIFWLQSALAGTATLLIFFLLPETIPSKLSTELQDLQPCEKFTKIWNWVNPVRILLLLIEYPNILTVAVASASLVWNMYSLLTPIAYVLNRRFRLDSPIQSGLFYIAPGCGYLAGAAFGGRWADRVVKRWIRKSGTRIPEDRLRSCLVSLGLIMPGSMLVYGWTVDQAVGGVPVPVLAMFVQGVAQLFCFPSLNTYCVDVMQSKGRSAEVVASNYMVRYLFGAIGSAVVLPAVDGVGVGWFSTISAGFLGSSALLVWTTVLWGKTWRCKVDEKKMERRLRREVGGNNRDAN